MASPDMNGDDGDDMMSALDELGDMIRQQQDLRDRTFRQGQDQRQQQQTASSAASKASRARGQQPGNSLASCGRASRRCAIASTNCSRISRTAALARTSRASKAKGKARPRARTGAGPGSDQLGRAGEAMGEAEGSSARAIPTARWIRKAAPSTPCARARNRWRNPCSSRWGRAGPRPRRPAWPIAREQRYRSARPAAARPRLRRRHHGAGAGRNRRAARPPHHRGIAQALRRHGPPAGGARLHRAAVEGVSVPRHPEVRPPT